MEMVFQSSQSRRVKTADALADAIAVYGAQRKRQDDRPVGEAVGSGRFGLEGSGEAACSEVGGHGNDEYRW